jgi:hypothetical protein
MGEMLQPRNLCTHRQHGSFILQIPAVLLRWPDTLGKSISGQLSISSLQVDQPDAPMDEYIINLRTVLREKLRAIEVLMDKINSFEQVLVSHKRGMPHQ